MKSLSHTKKVQFRLKKTLLSVFKIKICWLSDFDMFSEELTIEALPEAHQPKPMYAHTD